AFPRNGVGPALYRLTIPFAQCAQLAELVLTQIRVPVGEVLHRVVEPVLLVLGERVDHSTTKNVTEQLVAGLIEGGRGRCGTLGLLLAHLPSLRFEVSACIPPRET